MEDLVDRIAGDIEGRRISLNNAFREYCSDLYENICGIFRLKYSTQYSVESHMMRKIYDDLINQGMLRRTKKKNRYLYVDKTGLANSKNSNYISFPSHDKAIQFLKRAGYIG